VDHAILIPPRATLLAKYYSDIASNFCLMSLMERWVATMHLARMFLIKTS